MSHLSRREKRGIVALLIVGATPLGIAGYLSFLNIEPDIQIPARPPLPVSNGFDLYVQSAALTAQPNPPVDPSTDPHANEITAAKGAIRYGVLRRQAWHQGAASGWAKFQAAQRAQSYSPYGYDAKALPGYARLRQLARDKNAETRLFRMRGENNKALNSALDCVEMGFDSARGGGLIARWVCAAIVAIGISPMGESSADKKQLPEQLSGPQARAATARLEALMTNTPSWVAALQTGRFEALAQLKDGFKRDNWRAPDAFFSLDFSLEHEGAVQRAQRNLISKRAVVANVNRAYADAIAAQQKLYAAPVTGAPGLNDASAKYDLISAELAPRDNMRFNAAREQTQLDLLLLRLALQTYRAEKGVYPPNLVALQNGILKRIPTDDFGGGKPYFYTLKNGEYRLWSVGPDAKNDGGKAIADRSSPAGIPLPKLLPWQKYLPSMMPDSTGDVVAGKTR